MAEHAEEREGADPDRARGSSDQQRRDPHGQQGADPGAEIAHDQSGATVTSQRLASGGEFHVACFHRSMLAAATIASIVHR